MQVECLEEVDFLVEEEVLIMEVALVVEEAEEVEEVEEVVEVVEQVEVLSQTSIFLMEVQEEGLEEPEEPEVLEEREEQEELAEEEALEVAALEEEERPMLHWQEQPLEQPLVMQQEVGAVGALLEEEVEGALRLHQQQPDMLPLLRWWLTLPLPQWWLTPPLLLPCLMWHEHLQLMELATPLTAKSSSKPA